MRRKRNRRLKKINFKLLFKLDRKVILIIGFIILTLAILTGLRYLTYTCNIFKINKNNIISNVPLSESLKESILNQSLFELDIKSISSRLIREHPEYKEAYVFRRFPSSVVIDVKKRKPFAQIKGRKFYSLDREAVILNAGSNQSFEKLVLIEISDRNRLFNIGDRIRDKRLSHAFELIEVLQKGKFANYFRAKLINSTHLQGTFLVIEFEGVPEDSKIPTRNIKVILGESGLERKIAILKDLLTQSLKDKLSLVKYIDLRYKKVYVGFKR